MVIYNFIKHNRIACWLYFLVNVVTKSHPRADAFSEKWQVINLFVETSAHEQTGLKGIRDSRNR